MPNKTAKNLTALRMEFAMWLMDPYRSGTQTDWANAHGLQNGTLSDWKHHPEVIGLLESWREKYRPAFVDVAAAMFRKAKGGDVPAAKLLVEVLGLAAPTRIDVTTKMTLADYLAKIEQPEQSARRLS